MELRTINTKIRTTIKEPKEKVYRNVDRNQMMGIATHDAKAGDIIQIALNGSGCI